MVTGLTRSRGENGIESCWVLSGELGAAELRTVRGRVMGFDGGHIVVGLILHSPVPLSCNAPGERCGLVDGPCYPARQSISLHDRLGQAQEGELWDYLGQVYEYLAGNSRAAEAGNSKRVLDSSPGTPARRRTGRGITRWLRS